MVVAGVGGVAMGGIAVGTAEGGGARVGRVEERLAREVGLGAIKGGGALAR